VPPVNADAFDARKAFLPFPGILLNNDDINYVYTGPPFVVYRPNGGKGSQVIQNLSGKPATAKLKTLNEVGFTPPAGHSFKGWNTEPSGTGTHYEPSASVQLSAPLMLYAQWGSPTVSLTDGNTVTGPYAHMTKRFTFTITMADPTSGLLAGRPFAYTAAGGSIAVGGGAPSAGGVLTLDDGGAVTFELGNAQSITLADVPNTVRVRVVEAEDSKYTTAFTDSAGDGKPEADTGFVPIGNRNRTFAFVNTKIAIVPTGVSGGSAGAALLGFVALAGALGALGVSRALRRKATGCPRY
jgi:hypothetical protein